MLSELLWAARKKAESTKVSISSCEIDLRAEDSRSALSEIDLRAENFREIGSENPPERESVRLISQVNDRDLFLRKNSVGQNLWYK